MSYEVIIDISDVERRSFDFKRMFDESIPCKERIVRCRDCACFVTNVHGSYCKKSITMLSDPNGYCAWPEPKKGDANNVMTENVNSSNSRERLDAIRARFGAGPTSMTDEHAQALERELDAEIDSMQKMHSAIASLARSQPDKPVIIIAMERIADLEQLVRDMYDD